MALAVVSLAGCVWPSPPGDIPRLELVKMLPVVSEFPVEPSGLVCHAGILYAVCDKTDHWIFRLDIRDDHAIFVPHLRFEPPRGGPMDFEGITIDARGSFYLASEFHNRILEVKPDGDARWVSPGLRTFAQPKGLLRRHNAGVEGITLLEDGSWLLVAERENRGFIRVEPESMGGQVHVQPLNETRHGSALAFWRPPDFSGLARDGDRLFALFRNAHLVVQLERHENAYRESSQAWSYAHIENDPRFAYVEKRFGQAEGLAVSGQNVYIIFDNNQGPREIDSKDLRPQLMIARFPPADGN